MAVNALSEAAADARLCAGRKRASRRTRPKSFNVDLQDLSPDDWYLLPPAGDFLAEVETRRFDALTYTLTAEQAEDISVFRRKDA